MQNTDAEPDATPTATVATDLPAALGRIEAFLHNLDTLRHTDPVGSPWPADFSIDTCLDHSAEGIVQAELNESDLRALVARVRSSITDGSS